LHASYNAYAAAEWFVYEKEKLEEVAQAKIKGLRPHYWHIGRDQHKTLRFHEATGFGYDSSIAFNDHIGFRMDIALPYYP
jgi:hypothetical protein